MPFFSHVDSPRIHVSAFSTPFFVQYSRLMMPENGNTYRTFDYLPLLASLGGTVHMNPVPVTHDTLGAETSNPPLLLVVLSIGVAGRVPSLLVFKSSPPPL